MKLISNNDGQAVSEYALILALVGAVAITTLLALQGNVSTLIESVSNEVSKSATT